MIAMVTTVLYRSILSLLTPFKKLCCSAIVFIAHIQVDMFQPPLTCEGAILVPYVILRKNVSSQDDEHDVNT